MEIEDLKHCPKCNSNKSKLQFFKAFDRKDGRQGLCKTCQKSYRGDGRRKYEKDYYKNNPEKLFFVRRQAFLKRMYGISLEKYAEMLTSQNNECAICKKVNTGHPKQRYLCVDHDHKTGKIRGLLCSPCNRMLGLWEDDPKKFIRAANYLKENSSLT